MLGSDLRFGLGNNKGVPFRTPSERASHRNSIPGRLLIGTSVVHDPLEACAGNICLPSILSLPSASFVALLFAASGICLISLIYSNMAAVTGDSVFEVGQKARASLGPGKSRRCLVLCVGDENVSVV